MLWIGKLGVIFVSQLNGWGEHHITVPAHNPLKVGTLNAILRDVAEHFDLNRDELLSQLF